MDLLNSLEDKFVEDSISSSSVIGLEHEINVLRKEIHKLRTERDHLKLHLSNENSDSIEANSELTQAVGYLCSSYRLFGISIEDSTDKSLLVRFDGICNDTLLTSYTLSLDTSSYPPTILGHNFPIFIPIATMMKKMQSKDKLTVVLKEISSAVDAYMVRKNAVDNLKKVCGRGEYKDAVRIETSESGMFVQIFITITGSETQSFQICVSISYNVEDRFPFDVKIEVVEGQAVNSMLKSITKRSKCFKNLTLIESFQRLFHKTSSENV